MNFKKISILFIGIILVVSMFFMVVNKQKKEKEQLGEMGDGVIFTGVEEEERLKIAKIYEDKVIKEEIEEEKEQEKIVEKQIELSQIEVELEVIKKDDTKKNENISNQNIAKKTVVDSVSKNTKVIVDEKKNETIIKNDSLEIKIPTSTTSEKDLSTEVKVFTDTTKPQIFDKKITETKTDVTKIAENFFKFKEDELKSPYKIKNIDGTGFVVTTHDTSIINGVLKHFYNSDNGKHAYTIESESERQNGYEVMKELGMPLSEKEYYYSIKKSISADGSFTNKNVDVFVADEYLSVTW